MKSHYKDEWSEAVHTELNKLLTMETYTPVPPRELEERPQLELLTLKWVFDYKFDEKGYLTRFKARLIVRRDPQSPSDLSTFAATLSASTFRILCAICCVEGWETRQYDVEKAFINSVLDEEVFCRPPHGSGGEGYCWKLDKALYGLRRSPRLWFYRYTLAEFLKSQGFQQCKEDQCVFHNGNVIVFFFVDDIVIMHPKHAAGEWERIHNALIAAYKIRDLGSLNDSLESR